MTDLRFCFTEEQTTYLRDRVDSDVQALRNHIAAAVERGSEQYGNSGQTGLEYAQFLVPKLRKAEALFALFNGALLRVDGAI